MKLPPDQILVPCSTQYLADREGEWSEPLEIKADRRDDGTWELTLRRAKDWSSA